MKKSIDQILNSYMPSEKAPKNNFIKALDNLYRTVIDKSELMKRAHQFIKKGIKSNLSDALKYSWELEKSKISTNLELLSK